MPNPRTSKSGGGQAALLKKGIVPFRLYQRASFRQPIRRLARVWRRQGGKSYLLANEGLDWMMETPGCLTTIISAAISLGTEVLIKEAQAWRTHLNKLREAAAANGAKLETNGDDLPLEDFTDLFEHSKIEAKLWHDRTTCSRTRVIAPNPATAVGWTGHILFDEFGRAPNCQDVVEAVEPFMESNPTFRLRYATTPPPDDKHYSWEMLAPPPGAEWEARAEGNFYTSGYGLHVHRVTAWDAFEAGVWMHHPDTGEKITPDEHRALAFDKTAWDRNYGCEFVAGGTAAISLASLARAFALGKGECTGVNVTEEIAV
ncbi:MAG: hypothetical protein HZA93_24200 [Verrucomicrobia bacterium]|nr:hypothetical protein [Verrucomicrobiota bacterium]